MSILEKYIDSKEEFYENDLQVEKLKWIQKLMYIRLHQRI